ncbi:ribosomal-protein-serine acetyltransferase [Sphingobacterium mizutaii NBRC 14946 = DSM 11724]|mgnify:CR=1 FL=1|uniref:Ribosomal N-acetyltransferase YdaF n=2 Tax=Sphingobacterium mizutaii TaxID=1010 RepID=A0AAJ4XBH3_9SPHI|nr:GNAT family protein [Sphingobacterium mizutaii]GEM69817.1 ribosomal-protein-serine acetyltransferase [Sphingobacterium mizutaii NBRC 14946 = DSM 11724]SDK90170.1 ribosomal-protein-serine acetyltransferase [Sphingobacterium mizutaii]SNV47227.1 Putative ribosomal N-acetyltransferase YdaF [Sphingobacterium mizutaii]
MKRIIEIDQNLSLKAIVESDAIRMFNIINSQREYLGEWLPFVQFTNKVEDSKGFVEMAMLSRKLKKDYVYKICFDDRMIGLIGTKETDLLNKNTEIGYWLSQEFQNQGIMTRSVEALIQELFEELKLERIQICCAIGNEKSINIPKRLGFKLEGTKRNGEWMGNFQFRDLLVFSRLKSDKP